MRNVNKYYKNILMLKIVGCPLAIGNAEEQPKKEIILLNI